ncbi:MAG: tyrosine-type recombinase/integrase, partial [Halobacteria archaeon]|nr:tyrosine-type recombinase/integrase [Halobacteria archaeon]
MNPDSITEEDIEEYDLIEYFIEDMQAYGKSDSTVYEYERVVRDFDDFLDKHHARASRRDCMRYIGELRNRELSSSSIATYASYLHRFYSYLVKADEYPHTSNPMALVVEEMDEKIDKNPRRRELGVEDVIEFLKTVNHPRDRCMILMMFKTGIRAGELANLRLEHISLSEDENREFGLGRNALLNPNSILVSSDIEGNKRMRDTLVPVDDEMRRELVRWLRVRPETDTDALFVSLSPSSSGSLSSEAVSSTMRKYTKKFGWWSADADLQQNVTPHYCRHFFTTYLRESSGDDGLVKYLRGD